MKQWLWLLVIIGIAMLPVACKKESSKPPLSPDKIITGQWGGYDTTNEDQFFAEESHGTPYDGDEEGEDDPDDEIADDPDLLTLLADPNRVVYILRADWGQLQFNPNHKTVIDWAGSISTTRGAVIVRRVYRFEILTGDHIIRPRTDIKSVSWASTTSIHHDGLMVAIITLPDDNSSTTEVTFTTAYEGYERTFTLADLEAMNETVLMQDGTNRIAFNAAKTELGQLVDGVMGGRWASGKFLGRWIALDGAPLGRFAGIYGINMAGKRVFFGKIVQQDGTFMGLMKGGWCPLPFTLGLAGLYLGVYTDDTVTVTGLLGGHYIKSYYLQGGWFRGVWHEGLPAGWDPNAPPDPDPDDGTTPNP
ncbi:MAG: hypothetical protein E3J72_13235 [Planctomycetota bacterium]|nr:MAG: hypothetical protein E3J72_13235 [Planctomycetota bacterium]